MATHSGILAWKIPRTEEPGRLQSMGSLRVGKDWVTSLSLFTFTHWRREWQPTPVFLPGESQGRGAWWAAVYGVTQSRTQLRRLSSSSSMTHQSWPMKIFTVSVTSLVVQWLRLHSQCRGVDIQFLVRELRSHKQQGQKNKNLLLS